ncbi:kinesin family member pavarotti [Lycorma delicatula]|uniref:kinesin family member pavarotti n=1 Tax=Lycorma delicatula TaxID=130591 RepID=UPI003F5161D6
MKRNRATPKVNAKKICTSDSEKGSGSGASGDRFANKEPLQVFCRIRPVQNDSELSCIKVIEPFIIQVKSPELNRDGNYKEVQYMFKKVFDRSASQHDVFMNTAFDLVKNLVEGKNGLLFAYGITGSGKSYTMNGTSENRGIMPRCLDVLFNSISKFQTGKYVFKPDKMNGFDVQSEPDALLDRQRELISNIKTPSKFRKKESEFDHLGKKVGASSTSPSCSIKVDNVIEDNSYAVFVTYVEIYNNAVYDLMEEMPDDMRQRPLQPKLIREDGSHNMYVHGVNEVEVKSSEEAFDIYFKGQKRRRLAYTALNAESSRSHSVFTIRLVQAPLNLQGDSILQDRKKLNISQLSLVDLAGSERTSRAKTGGQRLREAGSINNSLLTLRTCLEILRENQIQGTNKMVPYRESRLTHFFKNFFDGEGNVRMIVCVNPRSDDYDETLQVLKFSEMSQEVQVNRPAPLKLDPGLTPGRRKANQIFKQTIAKLEAEGIPGARQVPVDISCVYRVGPNFPAMQWTDIHDAKFTNELKSIIQMRRERANELNEKIKSGAKSFRSNLEGLDKGYSSSLEEIKRLSNSLKIANGKIFGMEREIMEKDAKNSDLYLKVISTENNMKDLENAVAVKEQQLTDLSRERNRYRNRLALNTEKLTKEMQHKLKEQKSAMELEMWERDRKLQSVKRVLEGPSSCTAIFHSTGVNNNNNKTPVTKILKSSSETSSTFSSNSIRHPLRTVPLPNSVTATTTSSKSVECTLDLATPVTVRDPRRPKTVAVSKLRYRRSRSAGGNDYWLDHRPLGDIAIKNIMQPVMKRRKSITELKDVNDVVKSKTSKYCLTTQTVDSDGDLETCLYKADILPTAGGGAQVLFNDMEIVHHRSPQPSPNKNNADKGKNSPRSGQLSTPRDVIEERCAVSIEGHAKRSLI